MRFFYDLISIGTIAGAGEAALRHGYTVTDLDRAARMAIARNVGFHALSRSERYEIAWSAIALALYEAAEPPTLSDLASAGWYAIADARATEMRHHGIDHNRRIGETRRGFATYWGRRDPVTHEDRIVERVALGQIWHQLTDTQREYLTALAVHGTAARAAAALGKKLSTFHKTARAGRNAFRTLWWGDETPVTWGRDRRTADGSPVDTAVGYRQARRKIRRRSVREAAT